VAVQAAQPVSCDHTWGLGPAGAAGLTSSLAKSASMTAGTKLLAARLPVRGPCQ